MFRNPDPLFEPFTSFIDRRIILKDTEALLVIRTENLQPPYKAQMFLESLFGRWSPKNTYFQGLCEIVYTHEGGHPLTAGIGSHFCDSSLDPALFENKWCHIRVISKEQVKKMQDKMNEICEKRIDEKLCSLDFYYDLLVEVGVLKATDNIEFFYRNAPTKLAADLRNESKKDALKLIGDIYFLSRYLRNIDKRALPADLIYFNNRHQESYRQIRLEEDDKGYQPTEVRKLCDQSSSDNKTKICHLWNEYRKEESLCNSVMVSQLLPLSDADRQKVELAVVSDDPSQYLTPEQQLQKLFKDYTENKLEIDWNSDLGKNIQFVQDYLGLCVFSYNYFLRSGLLACPKPFPLPLPKEIQNIVIEYMNEYQKFYIYPSTSLSFFTRKEQKEQLKIEHKQENERRCVIM